jgi:hypothetical protein
MSQTSLDTQLAADGVQPNWQKSATAPWRDNKDRLV